MYLALICMFCLNRLLAFSVQFHFDIVSSRALSGSFSVGLALLRSDVWRCPFVCCISFALAVFLKFYFHLVFQFKPHQIQHITVHYI